MSIYEIEYSILDPTGNITALVESSEPADVSSGPVSGLLKDHSDHCGRSSLTNRQLYPVLASGLMKYHQDVEQVGFVNFASDTEQCSGHKDPELATRPETGGKPLGHELPGHELPGHADVELSMAGGEFCGNATMSAAALYLLRRVGKTDDFTYTEIYVKVSGAKNPLKVRLKRTARDTFRAGVQMPPAVQITNADFTFNNTKGSLPVVHMEGISHIIIQENSPFFRLKDRHTEAEKAIRTWCSEMAADGLGMMFLATSGKQSEWELIPLVYIPGSGTCFWENSCASGSTAAGMYLAHETLLTSKIASSAEGESQASGKTASPAEGENQASGKTTSPAEGESRASGRTASPAEGESRASGRTASHASDRHEDSTPSDPRELGNTRLFTFIEPGGVLQVESDPETLSAILWGSVRLTGCHQRTISIDC